MIKWEAHACLPLHPEASFAPLDAYRACGVAYVSVNVGMDMNPLPQVLSVIAGFRARIAAHPDRYLLAESLEAIERAQASGKLAIGFDLEGAMPLMEQPATIALYRDLGVRPIHLAYNRNNSVADGCHDVARGLTALGKRTSRTWSASSMRASSSASASARTALTTRRRARSTPAKRAPAARRRATQSR